MAFIILRVDREFPEDSDLVATNETEFSEVKKARIFKTEEQATRWSKKDDKDIPDYYDYHIIEVK